MIDDRRLMTDHQKNGVVFPHFPPCVFNSQSSIIRRESNSPGGGGTKDRQAAPGGIIIVRVKSTAVVRPTLKVADPESGGRTGRPNPRPRASRTDGHQ